MNVNSLKTKNNFHNYVTIKQIDNTSPIELILCGSEGSQLTNLNTTCTVTLLDTVDNQIRQKSTETIVGGLLTFKVKNALKANNHNLEVTLSDGSKYPSDGDFTILVSKSHTDRELEIINTMTYDDAIKKLAENVVTEFVEEKFNNLSAEDQNMVEVIQARRESPSLKDEITRIEEEIKQKLEYTKETFGDKILRIDSELNEALQKSYLYNKVYSVFKAFVMPNQYIQKLEFKVLYNLLGEVSFNYDVTINKIKPTKTYYVDVKTGSNNNAGTESQPFQSINRALRYGDADNIIVKEGIYGWSNSYNAYNQTKSYNLIGVGDVYIGAHRDNLTWSQHSTYQNVYQTNATSVVEVLDIKEDLYRYLEKLTSVEAVSNKAGSYYIDSSNNIYVRTHDSRKPDDYVLPQVSGSAAKFEDLDKVYIENIKFTNNVIISGTSNSKKAYAKNVTFSASASGNAVSVLGVDTIFQNCKALYASADGFNYHINKGILPNAIEIDCIGSFNGRDGANQNNGSTMHDGGKIIRIRGEYHHNHGPNVIDVNNGTQSLNIGVHAHHSTASADNSNADFRVRDEGGGSQMMLVNCVSHDSKYSLSIEGKATETVENSLLMSPTSRI